MLTFDYSNETIVGTISALSDYQLSYNYLVLQAIYLELDKFRSYDFTSVLVEFLDYIEQYLQQELCKRFIFLKLGVCVPNYPVI